MPKKKLPVFTLVFLTSFLQCASYVINIATVPVKQVEIFVNEEYKATTDENGTASVQIKRVSFEGEQLIEAKADGFYGCVTVSYMKNILPGMQNVYTVVNRDPKEGHKTALMQYNIVFIIPEGGTGQPLPEDVQMQALDDAQFWTETDLNERFEQCVYIATKKEKDDFKKLSFEEKKIFWDNFWKVRDSDTRTEMNEFKTQYFERVKKADQKFSVQQKAGWKTDRGRVWIVYGKPDEIEVFPRKLEDAAHEIWHYYGFQGGVEFVFVGVKGEQDLRLVHATARNELFDPDWERWLR